MAWIAQPYAQDTCGLGSSPIPAPEGAESRSGIDFVELKKLHQIASLVAHLRRPTPPARPFLSYPLPEIVTSS